MALFGDSKRIHVVARIVAANGREDEVRELLRALTGRSRKEDGCLKYDLFEEKHSDGSFFTFEEWENEDALSRHLELNKTELNKTKSLLREDIRIDVLNQLV